MKSDHQGRMGELLTYRLTDEMGHLSTEERQVQKDMRVLKEDREKEGIKATLVIGYLRFCFDIFSNLADLTHIIGLNSCRV